MSLTLQRLPETARRVDVWILVCAVSLSLVGIAMVYSTTWVRLVRDGDPGAEAAFPDLVARHPDDPLAAYHLARLRAGETGTTIVLRDK